MREHSGAADQPETNEPSTESPVPDGGILSVSLGQYREYAEEWKVFTRKATSDQHRKLGQAMVEIWLGAAARFEDGLTAAQSECGKSMRRGGNG
jgi:hypothetical protein